LPYKYEWHEDGFIVNLWGTLSIKELTYINSIWKESSFGQKLTWQIWDFTKADLQYIFESDMQDPKATLTLDGVRLALIATEPYTIQLLETYIERSIKVGSNWNMKVFKNIEDAKIHAKQ